MAILPYTLEIIKQLLPQVQRRPVEMLCLGYPDILVSKEKIRGIFGDSIADAMKFRDDSDDVLRWHRYGLEFGKVPETMHFMSLLGIRPTAIDIAASRGTEIIVDLNQPSPAKFADKFDIVLDAGTLEHCFNIAQGMRNALAMAKVNGFICHINPFSVPNHGFYNFNPTFYHDFYIDNGHALVMQPQVVWNVGEGYRVATVDPIARFHFNEAEANIVVVARKQHNKAPQWPMQSKYKINPALKR